MKNSLLRSLIKIVCAYAIGSVALLAFPGIRNYPSAWLAMHSGLFGIFTSFGFYCTEMRGLDWLIWIGLTMLWAACTFG